MTDVPPDRLSNNPKSPFYDEALLRRGFLIGGIVLEPGEMLLDGGDFLRVQFEHEAHHHAPGHRSASL